MTATFPNSMPIGAVVPFAGDVTRSQTLRTLLDAGWLPCDGDQYDPAAYPDLFAVIGSCHGAVALDGTVLRFRVPDLRGLYVRGVDQQAGVDPEASARTAHATGGNYGDTVGSYQESATAAPRNAFQMSSAGAHTHTIEGVTDDYHVVNIGGTIKEMSRRSLTTKTTGAAGDHYHAVDDGGDDETRPQTLCLNWIIRYLPASSTVATSARKGVSHVG